MADMPTYQMVSLNLTGLTQQGIAQGIKDIARNLHIPLQGSEFYDIKYRGTLDTPDKVKLHLIRMGAGGDGAYANLLLDATKRPQGLSDYLPDDNAARCLQRTLPISDFSREQPRLNQGVNNSKPHEKKYHLNIYSYAKYARIAYIKSAAKAAYGNAKAEIKNAVAKVYNSGRGFFRKGGQGELEQILATA